MVQRRGIMSSLDFRSSGKDRAQLRATKEGYDGNDGNDGNDTKVGLFLFMHTVPTLYSLLER
jgi:hypothetical protein